MRRGVYDNAEGALILRVQGEVDDPLPLGQASAHAHEYGFIIRYQKGWEEITGYEYEPWHVRYVGKENARRIHEQEMPLEEYLQIVRNERLLGIVEGTYLGEVEVEESGE